MIYLRNRPWRPKWLEWSYQMAMNYAGVVQWYLDNFPPVANLDNAEIAQQFYEIPLVIKCPWTILHSKHNLFTT